MSVRCVALVIIFVMNIRLCHGKRYDDYSLYNLKPETVDHVRFLQSLQASKYLDVKFWTSPNTRSVALIIHHKDEDKFTERTRHYNLKSMPVMRNIQTAFDHQVIIETPLHEYKNKWEYIRTLGDIYSWLKKLANKHSDSTTLESIGRSAEDRQILAFSINKPKKRNKFIVIVEAGAHGNEWLSTAIATFLIDQLLTSNFSPLIDLKNRYEWYFIPVLNPDGYEYSQTKDRLWRKNRRRTSGHSIGVDLNRNFDYKFGSFDASDNPEDENYCGPNPFSEPETRALRRFVNKYSDKTMFYFSLHGFGQKFIIPYSDSVKHTDNYNQMQNYARHASLKIFKYLGQKYHFGTAFETLGMRFSGDSVSWIKDRYKVPYTYTILPRDNGHFGYAMPNEAILPGCREMMLGVIELMQAAPPRNAKAPLSRSLKVAAYPLLICFCLFLSIINKC